MDTLEHMLLDEDGWIIECESPFEIRHQETGAFASGLAANYVLEYLRGLDFAEEIDFKD